MTLEGVTIGGKHYPPRVVIYGPKGIGKTLFASTTPNPIFILTEDGANEIKVAQYPVAKSWQEALDRLTMVVEGDHDHGTLVVDVVNGLADLCADHICTRIFNGDWGPKGFNSYAAGALATVEEFRKAILLLDKCRERGMMVMLCSHEGTTTVNNPILGDYNKFTPDLPWRIWGIINAWCDIAMHAVFDFTVAENSNKRKPGQAVGSSKRVLRCSGSAAEDAKSRSGFELPDEVEMRKVNGWGVIAAILAGNNSDTLDFVKENWGVFSEEEQAKLLAWTGKDTIDQATASQLLKLKKKIEEKKSKPAEKPKKKGGKNNG